MRRCFRGRCGDSAAIPGGFPSCAAALYAAAYFFCRRELRRRCPALIRKSATAPAVIVFNKPYGVLCQFTSTGGRPCLRDYVAVPDVYPAGRLDFDSEGLLVLTGDGQLQARIAEPRRKLAKTYWAQVEGVPSLEALQSLRAGLNLGDFVSRPCKARLMDEPEGLWPRNPPIRVRLRIPTAWIEMELAEGKNRQVRRMTAKVGHPTLRLIRAAIGPWTVEGLAPGEWRQAAVPEKWL
jgi:23S rRNA pseudouridine2457 synthase